MMINQHCGVSMRNILAVVLSFAFFLPTAASAQALPAAPYLIVKGHAQAELKPDLFQVELTVTRTGMSVPDITQAVESKTRMIVDNLIKSGRGEDDIKAVNLEIDAQYRFDEETDKRIFMGNRATRSITAKFDTLRELHAFLDSLPAGEDVHIGGVETLLRDQDRIKGQLLIEAVEDSKRAGNELASMYGQKIIGVHAVSDQPFSTGAYSLDRITVTGTRINKSLAEGTVAVNKDIYVVFLIGKQ